MVSPSSSTSPSSSSSMLSASGFILSTSLLAQELATVLLACWQCTWPSVYYRSLYGTLPTRLPSQHRFRRASYSFNSYISFFIGACGIHPDLMENGETPGSSRAYISIGLEPS